MDDFDAEIEYLDEDADLIQHCFPAPDDKFQRAFDALDSDATNASDLDKDVGSPVMFKTGVARKRVTRSQTLLSRSASDTSVPQKKESETKNVSAHITSKAVLKSKKRKRIIPEEDNSPDYAPRREQKSTKKKKTTPVKMHKEVVNNAKVSNVNVSDEDLSRLRNVEISPQIGPLLEPVKILKKGVMSLQPVPVNKSVLPKDRDGQVIQNQIQLSNKHLTQRNKLNVQIPDYDDPLCLPAKMVIKDFNDSEKIRNWNDLCLDHLQNTDILLKPVNGETKCSKKIVIFRNIRNEDTGKVETTIWSKTSVENERKEKKSEVFQSILPRYKDNTSMHYSLIPHKHKKPFSKKNEVILTKEEDKDGEILVAYRPDETVSSVYRMEKRKSLLNKDSDHAEELKKFCLRETTNCRVCALCYQASWRGARQYDKEIRCAICSRSYATIHNLISHLKLHSAEDVRKYKRVISNELAKVMDYHYKCRICFIQTPSIKMLKKHLLTHRGKEKFLCELGNHVTS